MGVVGDAVGTAALRRAADHADETLVDLVDVGRDGTVSGGTTVADLLVEATTEGFVITRPGVTRPLVPSSRARGARSGRSSRSSASPAGSGSRH